MINRGIAIRNQSEGFPPLDLSHAPYPIYPGYPGHWSPFPPHPHHDLAQWYSGHYLGYPHSPTVQIKQERPAEAEPRYPVVTSVIRSRASPQYVPRSLSPPTTWSTSSESSKSLEKEEKKKLKDLSDEKLSLPIQDKGMAVAEQACRIESVIKVLNCIELSKSEC